MRKLIIALFCILALNINAQINCVTYSLDYNQDADIYTANLVILDGSASTIIQRAQYNALVSIVVPTGVLIEIVESHNPIQNNQMFAGNVALRWFLNGVILEPEVKPENDFYAITPTLSPSSFYNELNTGDVIPLFSFITVDTPGFTEGVRLFNNETDPGSLELGMGGGNFSQAFRIAGSENIYYADLSESCITSTEEVHSQSSFLYPNPANTKLNIEHEVSIHSIEIVDGQGKAYYYTDRINQPRVTINTLDFPTGIYFCKIQFINGSESVQKFIKI